MGLDKQNVNRGRCRENGCDCTEYRRVRDGNRCSTCYHVAIKHAVIHTGATGMHKAAKNLPTHDVKEFYQCSSQYSSSKYGACINWYQREQCSNPKCTELAYYDRDLGSFNYCSRECRDKCELKRANEELRRALKEFEVIPGKGISNRAPGRRSSDNRVTGSGATSCVIQDTNTTIGTHHPSCHATNSRGINSSFRQTSSSTETHQPPPHTASGTKTHQPPPHTASGTETHQPPPHTASSTETHQPPPHTASGTETHRSPPNTASSTKTHQPPPHTASSTETHQPPPHTASSTETHQPPPHTASNIPFGNPDQPRPSPGTCTSQSKPGTIEASYKNSSGYVSEFPVPTRIFQTLAVTFYDYMKAINIHGQTGILVSAITMGGETCDLRLLDLVTHINGKAIKDMPGLGNKVDRNRMITGEEVSLAVWREFNIPPAKTLKSFFIGGDASETKKYTSKLAAVNCTVQDLEDCATFLGIVVDSGCSRGCSGKKIERVINDSLGWNIGLRVPHTIVSVAMVTNDGSSIGPELNWSFDYIKSTARERPGIYALLLLLEK